MARDPHPDQRLLDEFRAGDPDAFRTLVRPHLADLEAHARRHLDGRMRQKLSAADVVQEAQMVAFRRCADFDGRGVEELRRWLFAIVTHRARKAVDRYVGTDKRALDREVPEDERPDVLELLDAGGTPSMALADRELRARVSRAKQRLGAGDLELLRLVHDDRLNLREAAERLGRSYDAVRKQHARAVMRLGRAFRQLGGSTDDRRR